MQMPLYSIAIETSREPGKIHYVTERGLDRDDAARRYLTAVFDATGITIIGVERVDYANAAASLLICLAMNSMPWAEARAAFWRA